jgi:hypothetical protein
LHRFCGKDMHRREARLRRPGGCDILPKTVRKERATLENMTMRRLAWLCCMALFVAAPAVHATWSIVLTDSRTGEVAVGSATCVSNFDLLAASPVLVVGKGGGAAQSVVDSSGENRLTIRDGLLAGDSPQSILLQLQLQDRQFQSRQYGIADTLGRVVAFTGEDDGAYAGDRTGTVGTLTYSIQGNVLTGDPVLAAAEDAVLAGARDVPGLLMRAMQAAAEMGGDGRCSCSPIDPTGCGSPPPDFEKSADVGYALDARLGDTDGGCNAQTGCASGDYHLVLNVAFQQANDPDPVLQLRHEFAQWRRALVGRPDHYLSRVALADDTLPPDGTSTTVARVQLRDWRGGPITAGAAVDVSLDPSSTTAPAISPVVDLGGGAFAFRVTASTTPGVARFLVVADDGVRRVLLAPLPELEIAP